MKKVLYGIILILLVLLCIFLYFNGAHSNKQTPTADGLATEWSGEQKLPTESTSIPMIAIPGISKLVFKADTTEQKVNFYNPEENNCLFLMSLYVADTCYWNSGYVEAGKGFYEITLSQPIPKGNYGAFLQIRCFTKDGTELNSANVSFELIVE